jgi:hypothetical protein
LFEIYRFTEKAGQQSHSGTNGGCREEKNKILASNGNVATYAETYIFAKYVDAK